MTARRLPDDCCKESAELALSVLEDAVKLINQEMVK